MTSDVGSSCLIVNANVEALDDRQPTGEAVLSTDFRIDRVGSSAKLRSVATDAEILDVAGACVLPGLIDGHTHFEMTSVCVDHCINADTPHAGAWLISQMSSGVNAITPQSFPESCAGPRSACGTK